MASAVARLLADLEEADRRAWAASAKLLAPFNKSGNRRFLTKGERRRLAHQWEALPAYGRLRCSAVHNAEGGVHLLEERCRARAGSLVIVRRSVRLLPQSTLGLSDHRKRIARVPAAAIARWFEMPAHDDVGLFAALSELTVPPVPGSVIYVDRQGRIVVALEEQRSDAPLGAPQRSAVVFEA